MGSWDDKATNTSPEVKRLRVGCALLPKKVSSENMLVYYLRIVTHPRLELKIMGWDQYRRCSTASNLTRKLPGKVVHMAL